MSDLEEDATPILTYENKDADQRNSADGDHKMTESEANGDHKMTDSDEESTHDLTYESKDDDQQNGADGDLSMFASVWVKVEVADEEDPDYENPLEHIEVKKYSKRKKKNPQKILKELKCDLCDYTTVYKNCLQLHILSHTNYKPFSCESCPYVTRYPTSLQRHMITQHEYKNNEKEKELPVFTCDQCPYTSYYKWNLSAHKRKHKLEKEFKCELCTYTTAYRHNYLKHSKVHNKTESFYKCDKCPFVTKFEGHITRHLAKIHNEVSDKANRCDLCDFSTKVRWRLNIHKQRSKQNDIIKCIYCDFETYYMCESKKHKTGHYSEICTSKKSQATENESDDRVDVSMLSMQSMHEPDVLNQTTHERNNHYMIDPVCELDWGKIQVMESTNKERPFQCIMCKYTARFKASVQRHYQRHHTGSQNRPYKCLNCDFSTKTKDQISLHNKRSQSEIKIYCRTCDFSTNFKCQYVVHQKLHYEHKCSMCDYTCKNKYEITKHFSTVHLGNGLKCRFCEFRASRTETLLRHETIHTGNKPFKCSYCDYMAIRRSLLLNHMKRNHEDMALEIHKEEIIINGSKIESLKVKGSLSQIENEGLDELFQNGESSELNV